METEFKGYLFIIELLWISCINYIWKMNGNSLCCQVNSCWMFSSVSQVFTMEIEIFILLFLCCLQMCIGSLNQEEGCNCYYFWCRARSCSSTAIPANQKSISQPVCTILHCQLVSWKCKATWSIAPIFASLL